MALSNWSRTSLDAVFGVDSVGDSPEERAKTSKQLFVRSQVQIALANERATGRKLSATEALDNFGSDILFDLSHKNAVPLILRDGEPGKTIQQRRNAMGLLIEDLSKATGISQDEISFFEEGRGILNFRKIEKIAKYLVLDESVVGYEPGSGGDPQLGVRFKTFFNSPADQSQALSSAAVLRLSDAAWVVKKQLCLQAKLSKEQVKVIRELGIIPSTDYRYPAYKKGYSLAAKTRQLLNFDEFEPISSLTELVEETLCIPVVQTELSSRLAGATVAPSDAGRGIILNTKGLNSNIFVRRTTLAHELGHLLWDPEHRLNKLVVDEYEGINNIFTDSFDEVEARANAFAAEFLAPASGVKEIFKSHYNPVDGLRAVMEYYGVSFTTARWQLINSKVASEEDNFSGVDKTHSHDWTINEEARLSYSPIPSIPESRRGRFEKLILDCVSAGIISSDSAASCLSCTEEEFLSHHATLKKCFDI